LHNLKTQDQQGKTPYLPTGLAGLMPISSLVVNPLARNWHDSEHCGQIDNQLQNSSKLSVEPLCSISGSHIK